MQPITASSSTPSHEDELAVQRAVPIKLRSDILNTQLQRKTYFADDAMNSRKTNVAQSCV